MNHFFLIQNQMLLLLLLFHLPLLVDKKRHKKMPFKFLSCHLLFCFLLFFVGQSRKRTKSTWGAENLNWFFFLGCGKTRAIHEYICQRQLHYRHVPIIGIFFPFNSFLVFLYFFWVYYVLFSPFFYFISVFPIVLFFTFLVRFFFFWVITTRKTKRLKGDKKNHNPKEKIGNNEINNMNYYFFLIAH